ncbi:MAG: MFS transporter [Bacteroides sp.]|nr:MFS transporter [Bacteroides sp.]MCM1414059.1 MFS transporter [Bacteroides sp.]MCM1472342.1 MFS transporter [Bacteroides sp.]
MNDTNSTQQKSERLWNKEYIKVMVGNFLMFFSFYLITPILPIYLDTEFSADKDMIGLVLSGYVVAALIVRPFSGFIVDCFDRKRVLMICFFAFFICFTGYIGASTILMFALIRTIHGLPFGATTVANSTVAIDVLPSSRRNEGMGFYGLSNNLAMAIAPTAGIYLYNSTGNFRILFWASLAVAFLAVLTVSSIHTRRRAPMQDKPKLSLDHFFLTRGWLPAVNIVLFGLSWGVMANYVAIYSKDELGITDGAGIFYAVIATGLFVSRLIGAKSLREGHLTQNAIQGAFLTAVGLTLFACTKSTWAYYLSALMLGLGNGRMYPAFLNMFINLARHDQRGTANSTILTAWDSGMGLGILLGGVFVEYTGYRSAFWFTAAAQTAGALLMLLFTRRFYLSRRLR